MMIQNLLQFLRITAFYYFFLISCSYYYIVTCGDLPDINNSEVSYTPPRVLSPSLPDRKRYAGTIATYNCLSGYQLVGGSSLRACGANGQWNGTAPSCGKFCEWSHVVNFVSGPMYNY